MTINFTGIKNAGSMMVMLPGVENKMQILSLQVTNDETGNHLDEFNKAIKKSGKAKQYKTAYEGAVSINVSSTIPEDEYIRPEHTYYLNGSPLEVNDKNLPIFSYLAKLTREIPQKKDKDLRASVEYASSPEFINGTSIGYFIKRVFMSNPNIKIGAMLNGIYNAENTKAGAQIINDAISETMTDYLG